MAEMLDVRCPVDPRRMFLRLASGIVCDGNLVEVACPECARRLRRSGDPQVRLVLHRYDIAGECIETETLRADP